MAVGPDAGLGARAGPPLRIGVNALYLIPGGVGGSEIYLRSLLAALSAIDKRNEYFVFANAETGPDLVPDAANFKFCPQKVKAAFRPARIMWEQTCLPQRAASLKLNVLLNGGFTAPLVCGCPQVTVFYDLQHKRHPEYYRWYERPIYNALLYCSARVSSRLIAISDATAKDLATFYPFTSLKTTIAPLGVEGEFEKVARRRTPEPFLLTVATLHPHKNLDGLLRAFRSFRGNHPEFSLVVCGMHGLAAERLHALRDELGLRDSVRFPGWIEREAVYDLYARAWAFVYPTLFEGFGLPLLEAMAAGVPTACSAIEPLTTISGNQVVLFDPKDQRDMCAAMERITTDDALRTQLSIGGRRRVMDFSWIATAGKTLSTLLAAAALEPTSEGSRVA